MRKAVNYQNKKEYLTITGNISGFKTACTSISFQNKGAAGVNLVLTSGKGTLRLEAGESISYNNPPDVMENDEYNLVFDPSGDKKLFVLIEQVTRIFGGESAGLPDRTSVPVNENPNA